MIISTNSLFVGCDRSNTVSAHYELDLTVIVEEDDNGAVLKV